MLRGPVVVTGAAGFLGSHLCRRLLGAGHRVTGVDVAVGPALSPCLSDPNFDLVRADLGEGCPPEALKDASAVFHFAARPGVRESDRDALVHNNVGATDEVIRACEAAAVRDLILASSSSVYGPSNGRASREADTPAPTSVYGWTKSEAEKLCLSSGLRSVVLRFFTVYGPGQRPDMAFSRFMEAAIRGEPAPVYHRSDAARDFTFVDDAIDATMAAWERARRPIYNVSGGCPVRIADARRMIGELVGREVPVQEATAVDEPLVTRADLTHARADLAYTPHTDLRTGLRRQLEHLAAARVE